MLGEDKEVDVGFVSTIHVCVCVGGSVCTQALVEVSALLAEFLQQKFLRDSGAVDFWPRL